MSGSLAQLSQLVLVLVDLTDGPALAVDVGEQGAASLIPAKGVKVMQ